MAKLSERERIDILRMIGFGDKLRTHQEACQLFNATYPDRPPITQSTVSRVLARFEETGSVKDAPRAGRPRVDDETRLNILVELQDNPHSSTRSIALNNDISHVTVVNFLKKEKFHPYKGHLIHALTEDDPDRRLHFCEDLMHRCNGDPDFLKNIIFSDEATFYLNGSVHRHNCRYWSQENPHWVQEVDHQHPRKVNVWAGIIGRRILGPYFFEENLTAARYLDFLRFDLVPSLAELFPNNEDPDIPEERIWFQQDGAPPHYGVQVREYLNNTFTGRWIGRRGTIEWPPRSPDLTPLDFFCGAI
jgi:Transposase.